MTGASAKTSLLSRRCLIPVMALLATLPVWTGHLPLGTDIPQHAAQISLALDHFSTRTWVNDIQANYLTPYLLTYVIGALLAKLIGIVASVKVLISLSLGGTVLATARLLGCYGRDPRLALFAIFGLYGFTYQWGFLPFNLSAVLMILLLAESRPQAPTSPSNLARCLALALAIVITHGLSAVVMAGMLLMLTLMEPAIAARMRNYLLVLLLLAPVVCWQLFASTGVKGFGNGIYFGINPLFSPYFYYQEMSALNHHVITGWGRLSGFFPRILGWANGTAATLAGIALLGSPFLLGYRLSIDKKTVALNVLLLLILLAMPSIINGSLYSAERFSLLFFCFMPLLIATTRPKTEKLLPFLLLTSLLFIAGNVLKARDHDRQISGLTVVLAELPARQRALFMSYSYRADGFIAPIFLHGGQWYGVLKNGLVDPGFAATDLQPMRYLPQKLPYATIGNGFDWKPGAHAWHDFHGENYSVYVIHGPLSAFETHTGCKITQNLKTSGQWSAFYMSKQDARSCPDQQPGKDPL